MSENTPVHGDTTRKQIEAIERRVLAAVWDAKSRRSLLDEDWPECHKVKCSGRHGDLDVVFGNMKRAITNAVAAELRSYATTRPDVADTEESPRDAAVYTLAALLNRYNVRHAGTFVNAARLIVDAYPGLIPALSEQIDHDG